MSKTFIGFTNQQTHQLLKESGYTGPAQKDDMDKFLAASPKAAAALGRYTEIARQRIEGGALAKTGLAAGDLITEEQKAEAPDSQRIGDVVTGGPVEEVDPIPDEKATVAREKQQYKKVQLHHKKLITLNS